LNVMPFATNTCVHRRKLANNVGEGVAKSFMGVRNFNSAAKKKKIFFGRQNIV
jgi:hypothetical protein